MMRAGRTEEIRADSGKWVIIDIGFANSARSCGLLLEDGPPVEMQFGEAVDEICKYVSVAGGPVNLLIEAPLSVAFDLRGNPKGRSIERQNSSTRYWYVGLGCGVMVAAMYLVKAVVKAQPNADVRLFEGFVSYKQAGKKRTHCEDVAFLKEVVSNPDRYSDAIVAGGSLKMDPTDTLNSAFLVAGVDLGIPPIIMRNG
jgi:hypothetical protein